MREFCGFVLIGVVERQFDVVAGLPRRLAPPRNDVVSMALRAITKQSRSGGVSVATQAVAARHCGITQPRINDLVRGCLLAMTAGACVIASGSVAIQIRKL